jgi:hypothetical protein
MAIMASISGQARVWRTLGGWIIGGALASFTILPICDLSFDCGCMQGYENCDVHVAGMPDCPWCMSTTPIVLSLIFSYGAGLLAAWVAAKALPLAWVPVVSGIVVISGTIVAGAVTALLTGRPVLPGF